MKLEQGDLLRKNLLNRYLTKQMTPKKAVLAKDNQGGLAPVNSHGPGGTCSVFT